MIFSQLRRVGILFLLVVLLVSPQWAGPSRAGDNIWTTTGPYGVYVTDILIDPSNAQRLYASTGGTVPIYRSEDGGQSWQPSFTGLPVPAPTTYELAGDPNDSQTVYAATRRGLYKSSNAGVTWELRGSVDVDGTAKPMKTLSIAISPSGDRMYAVGGGGGEDLAPIGIYVSSDGGDTFQPTGDDTVKGTELGFVRIAPSAPHILFMAGNFDGLYKSIDGGQSWDRADSAWGSPLQFKDVAFDPYSADTVYVSASGAGIFRTTNGGATWAPVASVGLNSTEVLELIVDPGNQQVIYVAGGDGWASGTPGVYRSLDNLGLSWEHLANGMGVRGVHSLAIDHEEPQTLYAGTRSGIWSYTLISGPEDYTVSMNDGALFTRQTAVTLTLTAPPGTDSMLLSNDGGFGGASWESYATTKPWQIAAYGQSVVPRVVYAKFRNGGQTSGLYLDDIILDTTPPDGGVEVGTPTLALVAPTVGSSLVDASPAPELSWTRAASNTVYLPMVVKNVNPSLSFVKLLLTASDDVSGVESMVIGLKPDLSDGRWEPYAESKTMWLPQSGLVYVQYRDRAGNVSRAYSDGLP